MTTESPLHPALLWEALPNDQIHCRLCHHGCIIAPGRKGRCCVRLNQNGRLVTLAYDRICAAQIDPIEKKPFFHFLPGTFSFSVATEGCNFQCAFCQNWQISQRPYSGGALRGEPASPAQIVTAAQQGGCRSIAYTYTEPTIYLELAAACGTLARQRGLANVFVSNGYMTRDAIELMADWLDGINIDLKAFNDRFYREQCHGRLSAVLDTIETIARDTNIWMELTTLIVPGQNDDPDELKAMADFIVQKAGPHVPWHISRFTPQYQCRDLPATALETLERAYHIGKAAGLHYVYLGNVPGSPTENTCCSECDTCLIERVGYHVKTNRLHHQACPECGTAVAGYFEISS